MIMIAEKLMNVQVYPEGMRGDNPLAR
jgi:hypothetical protein